MPRANRHFLPGHVWHLTRRCHHKAFLLKFARGRRRYLRWVFEAKNRFGLSLLNCMVTSNHSHLKVRSELGVRAIHRLGSTFTETDWAGASQATGEPTPPVTGMTSGNLSCNTTYAFALKTVDAAGNSSAISNVVTQSTVCFRQA